MSVSPAELVARMEGVRHWPLEVVAVDSPTPRTRRIRLGSARPGGLTGLSPLPGQDLMFWVPRPDGSRVYRRYTIRRMDPAARDLEVVVVAAHEGAGPGATWAASLAPGDRVDAVGPRGKITIVPASFHLFVGDDAYVPTAFAMMEGLPAGARAVAVLEETDAAEERRVRLADGIEVHWLHRDGAPPGEAARLVAALSGVRPEPSGHAYVGAELAVTASAVDALCRLGLDPSAISSKAYWRRGRPNAERGEPPKEDLATR